jgi:hypothetical protein
VQHNLPSEVLASYIQNANAGLLIAEAGAVDLSVLMKEATSLNHAIWVAKYGSRHMDWSQVPEGIGGEIEVAVWHELVKDRQDFVGHEVPYSDLQIPAPPLTTVWCNSDSPGYFVEYTHGVGCPSVPCT